MFCVYKYPARLVFVTESLLFITPLLQSCVLATFVFHVWIAYLDFDPCLDCCEYGLPLNTVFGSSAQLPQHLLPALSVHNLETYSLTRLKQYPITVDCVSSVCLAPLPGIALLA